MGGDWFILVRAELPDGRSMERKVDVPGVDAASAARRPSPDARSMHDSLEAANPSSPVDLMGLPVLGRFLRWRHARTALQLPLLLLAVLMVFDGLTGPQLAPKNLATVLTWVHYRGLVVLALLLVGNLF